MILSLLKYQNQLCLMDSESVISPINVTTIQANIFGLVLYCRINDCSYCNVTKG